MTKNYVSISLTEYCENVLGINDFKFTHFVRYTTSNSIRIKEIREEIGSDFNIQLQNFQRYPLLDVSYYKISRGSLAGGLLLEVVIKTITIDIKEMIISGFAFEKEKEIEEKETIFSLNRTFFSS